MTADTLTMLIECRDCYGTGWIRSPGPDDDDLPCQCCEGTGACETVLDGEAEDDR